MKNQKQAKIWEIFGGGLDSLYIIADSFDDALLKARVLNYRYDSGRIHNKPMCDFSGKSRFCKTMFPDVLIPTGRKHNVVDGMKDTDQKEYTINFAMVSREERRGGLLGKVFALFTEHGFDERQFKPFTDKMIFYTNTKIIAYCAGKPHLGNIKSCDEYFERIEINPYSHGYHFTAENDFEALKAFAKIVHDESGKRKWLD